MYSWLKLPLEVCSDMARAIALKIVDKIVYIAYIFISSLCIPSVSKAPDSGGSGFFI
jgi:hypothetical protein